MKYLVKFFVITIIAFACTSLYAQNVYFIDMEKIINESSAGKYAKESIQNTYNENIQSFKDAEKKLKKKKLIYLIRKKC